MLSLFREGFWRDIGLLIVTGIVAGALLASGAARLSDTYFGTTVDGIIGRFGEYDLIVHVREEFKGQAEREITRILRADYPGARVEPSLSVAGRANFLIALPDKMRTRSGLESLSRAFWNIPGAAGSTFIIEPRAVVSGVEPGAIEFLIDHISRIDGVRFCFRDGSSIGIVARSLGDLPRVTGEVKVLLNRYRVLDVRLPMGQEFPDAPGVGANLVEALKQHSPGLVRDITSYGRNSDLKDLMATLAEMKKFLQYYAARATISLAGGVALKPGDTVMLKPREGAGRKVPEPGVPVLEVEIRDVRGAKATGIVVAGDVRKVADTSSFAVYSAGGKEEEYVGTAAVASERRRLNEAVDQSISLVKGLKTTASHGAEALSSARHTIDLYDDVLAQLVAAQRALEDFRDGIVGGAPGGTAGGAPGGTAGGAPGGIAGGASPSESGPGGEQRALKDKLDGALKIIDRFAASLETLDFLDRQLSEFIPQGGGQRNGGGQGLSPNVSTLVSALTAWRDRARSLARSLSAMSDLAKAGTLPGIVSGVLDSTNGLLVELQNADIGSLKESLDRMSSDLKRLQELDTSAMLGQLDGIKKSLPDIRDEQVGRSVKLIESYMGGQVIPGERLSILIGPGIPEKEALALAKEATRGFDIAAGMVPPGMLEPGLRSEVYRVMTEARSAIATLVAFVFAFFSLLLDHSAAVSSIICFGRGRRHPRAMWAEAAFYMAGAGAVLTSGIYLLSGIRFSWVGPYQVALMGGLMGLALSAVSPRVNPVNVGEVEGCEAMGMPYSSIMREIIIPEARPGIFQLLNRMNIRHGGRPAKDLIMMGTRRAGEGPWPLLSGADHPGGGSTGIVR